LLEPRVPLPARRREGYGSGRSDRKPKPYLRRTAHARIFRVRMSEASEHRPEHGTQHRVGRASLALLLMVILWGINFPIAKAALRELSPLAFNALRYPFAALVVLIALRWRGGVSWPAAEDRMRVLMLGLFGNLVYQQFFIFGLDLTRAGTASILLASTPILTALLSSLVGHERPGVGTWLGVTATFAGIALVVTLGARSDTGGDSSLAGNLLMLAASLSWAGYTVGSRSIIQRYGSVLFTAWTLWVGTAALLLVGLPSVLRTDLGAVSASGWFGVVYAGAFSIGIAYLIWYYGVRQIGNTRTAVFSNLVPVVALAAAWIHLGEVPRLGQVAGAAIIIGGVTLTQIRSQAAPR
jgi:drug/metabolite transporter (DMT)-like permease